MQVGKFVWRDCEPASSREVLCLCCLLCISRLRMSGSDNLSLGDAGILSPICAQLQVGTMRSLCVHDSTGRVSSRLSSSTQGHARSVCTLLAVSSRSAKIILRGDQRLGGAELHTGDGQVLLQCAIPALVLPPWQSFSTSILFLSVYISLCKSMLLQSTMSFIHPYRYVRHFGDSDPPAVRSVGGCLTLGRSTSYIACMDMHTWRSMRTHMFHGCTRVGTRANEQSWVNSMRRMWHGHCGSSQCDDSKLKQ